MNHQSAMAAPSIGRRAVPQQAVKLSPMVIGFLLVMAVPATLSFNLGTVLITPSRFYLLGVIPFLISEFAARKQKLIAVDWLILVFSVWATICIFRNYGASNGIERAGSFVLEVAVSYFLARVCLRSLAQVRAAIRWMFMIALVALVLAIPEAITHQKPIITYTARLTGMDPGLYTAGTDIRMGLRRAQAFFENPILFGLFAGALFSFLWYFERGTTRLWKLAVVVGAVLTTLSTTPLLVINFQLISIVIERVTRTLKNRIAIISTAVAAIVLGINTFTGSGVVGILISYVAFSQASSYNRVLIWDFGMQNILQNPIFGMIPDDWVKPAWMSDSIDNFWIFNGLLTGIPGWILTASALIVAIVQILRIPRHLITGEQQHFRLAWVFVMLAFGLGGFCGTFFGKLQPFYYFMVGMGAASIPLFRRQAERASAALKLQRAAQRQPAGPREAHALVNA